MSPGDFLELLLAQLRCQDPLKPMSNEEMLSQVATINQIQMSTMLTQTLQTVASQQEFGSASALIGKYVRGLIIDGDGNSREVSGVVSSVHFASNGQVVLELDGGQMLPIESVVQVGPGAVQGEDGGQAESVEASASSGDLDGDGRIDEDDLRRMVEAYGGPGEPTDDPAADLDGDGDVDLDDFRVLTARVADQADGRG